MLSADWAQAVDTVHSWDRMRWERNACDANWKRGTVIIAVVHFNWTITKTFSTHNTQHWIIRRREIKERSIHNFIINQVTSPFVDITFHFLFDIHGSSHKKNICQCGKTMRLFSLRKIQPSSDELNEPHLKRGFFINISVGIDCLPAIKFAIADIFKLLGNLKYSKNKQKKRFQKSKQQTVFNIWKYAQWKEYNRKKGWIYLDLLPWQRKKNLLLFQLDRAEKK